MTNPAKQYPGLIWRRILNDLTPFPGRFQLSWQVALVCSIAAAVSMTFRIPEAAISIYLVIFLMKRDALNNCIMALGLVLLAALVVAGMVPLISATADSPAVRLAIIFGASFVFLYLSSATMLGEQAAIVGLIIAFLLTLVSDVPVANIADQGLLMAWKMVLVPMAVMFLFSLVAGPAPQRLVRDKIAERLRCAAGLYEIGAHSGALRQLLSEGNQALAQKMMLTRVLRLAPRPETLWLTGAVATSYQVLVYASRHANLAAGETCPEHAAVLNRFADQVAAGEFPKPADACGTDLPVHDPIMEVLAKLATPDGGSQPDVSSPELVSADALTNPEHLRFALKTASAALLCYLLYTGIHWDGIHTAMITCYVASLGSVGETVHKLVLRIGGCLVGATLGVASLFFIMPYITSVGGLMILVFLGVLAGAWVSSGSERINYAGVQIALAFLLTVLNDFGPSFEFSQASDRIIGILVGNLVVFLIFTRFWPKSALLAAGEKLSKAAALLERATDKGPPSARNGDIAEVHTVLAEADRLIETAVFETAHMHPRGMDRTSLRVAVEELRYLAIELACDEVSPDQTRSSLAETLAKPGLLPASSDSSSHDIATLCRGGA
jgi:multidrug resistance protein MdtO